MHKSFTWSPHRNVPETTGITDTQWQLLNKITANEGGNKPLEAEIMFRLFAKPIISGPNIMKYIWPENHAYWNFGMKFFGKDLDWFHSNAKKFGENPSPYLFQDYDGEWVQMNSLRIPPLTTCWEAMFRLKPANWLVSQMSEYVFDGVSGVKLDDVASPASVFNFGLRTFRTEFLSSIVHAHFLDHNRSA